jgi:hypothetical protein
MQIDYKMEKRNWTGVVDSLLLWQSQPLSDVLAPLVWAEYYLEPLGLL